MHRSWKRLGLIAISLVLASGTRAFADDEEKLAKAPAAVQATVKMVLGDGKLEGCDTVKSDGKTAYDIDLSVKGTAYAMLVAENGEIIEREVEVMMAIVPGAVVNAGNREHPDGKVSEASIITHGDQMYYELEIMVGKDEHDLDITPTGKVLSDTIAVPEAPEATTKAAGEKDEKKEGAENKD